MSATGALARLTGPLRRALDGLDRRAHLAGRARANVSEDQLRDLVEEVTDAAGDQLIEPEDLEMMHSVVELGQTVVREVMVPRTAMVTIAASADLAQAMALFLQSGHSRVPVRGQDADDIVGVAYLKDAALAVWRDEAARGRTAAAVARPAFFVPESKPV
ncbi:MAG: CBS domain-containing protein, partial [Bifidobacteriaceae bacterium]|nr:CBS domain-containing protein [Bifidobacteriaceae bacterium]